MSMIIKMLDKLNEDGIPMERVVLGAAVDTPEFIRELRKREQEDDTVARLRAQEAALAGMKLAEGIAPSMNSYNVKTKTTTVAEELGRVGAYKPIDIRPPLNEDQEKVIRVFQNLIPKIVASMRGLSAHFGLPESMRFDLPNARVDVLRHGKNFQISYTERP